MAHLVVLALVLFAGASYGTPTRIAGGTATTIHEVPSIAQIERVAMLTTIWTYSCIGTILNERWLLSAAHCFEDTSFNAINTRARAGATQRGSTGMVAQFDRVYRHPEYRAAARYDADIALVRLRTLLTLGSTIQQAAIVPQGFVLPDNSPVTIAGWGTPYATGELSRQLMSAQVNIINNQLCKEHYATIGADEAAVTENMICAGVLDVGGQDVCNGNSGGPLYFGNVLVGVVSWGVRCGDPFFPSVFTSVSSYTDWIVRTVQ